MYKICAHIDMIHLGLHSCLTLWPLINFERWFHVQIFCLPTPRVDFQHPWYPLIQGKYKLWINYHLVFELCSVEAILPVRNTSMNLVERQRVETVASKSSYSIGCCACILINCDVCLFAFQRQHLVRAWSTWHHSLSCVYPLHRPHSSLRGCTLAAPTRAVCSSLRLQPIYCTRPFEMAARYRHCHLTALRLLFSPPPPLAFRI